MILFIRIHQICSIDKMFSDIESEPFYGYIDTDDIEFISEPPQEEDNLGIIVMRSGNCYIVDKYEIDETLFQLYVNNKQKYSILEDDYGEERKVDEKKLKKLDITL